MNVLFTARALRQIDDIGIYLDREDPRAALELLARIRSACLHLADHPRAGHPTRARAVRVITMARDPYRIFYDSRPSSEQLRILQVRHTSRRPLRRYT